MNDYQKEQSEGLAQLVSALETIPAAERRRLRSSTESYMRFRHQLDQFLATHFNCHCTRSCYENNRSACCSKDGIITFWADLVINALWSHPGDIKTIANALQHPANPHKCIYLGKTGCIWRVRPLGCAMFLCDPVQETVFGGDKTVRKQWRLFLQRAETFRWPDRPVLFDTLEHHFIALDCRSPLMYLNTSPGLLRVKKQAGLIKT